MFDFGIGYTELFVIAVVAVIVIGPKDLPKVLRAFGKTMTKMRGMAREFQGHLDAAMRDSGLDEVKKEVQSIRNLNPVTAVKNEVSKTLKKEDDDFKKYFGELDAKAKEEPKPEAPPPKTDVKASS